MYFHGMSTPQAGSAMASSVPPETYGLGTGTSSMATGMSGKEILSSASLGLMIGGAFGAGASAFINAGSQKSFLKYQADMADINARMSELQAQSAVSRGKSMEQQVLMDLSNVKSKQKVGFAANGVDLQSQVVADVRDSTNMLADMDIANVRLNAAREAFGYRVQATNERTKAQMARTTAGGISPGLSAATSLLGSGGSVAERWYMMNRSGGLGTTSSGTTK